MDCLLLYRKDPNVTPSAAEMQQAWGQWKAWMTKFAKEIREQPPARSGPKPGGQVAVSRRGAVTDGPFIEGKEIVGGWSFVVVDSFARALEIAREVPSFDSVEVIEVAQF
jgi:hypothetical protein